VKYGPYEIATYGGPREESARACAVRFARMATALATIHPAFARWNRTAYTARRANAPFCTMPPDIGELTKTIERGRQIADVSREVMRDLGFSISGWNGEEGPGGVGFRMHVGAYTTTMRFPNQAHFTFGRLEEDNQDLLDIKILKAVLLTLVDAWEPDWAVLTDDNYIHALVERGPFPRFSSGWVSYLAAPYARKVLPPPKAIVEPVAGGGILMLATNEPFSIDQPEHVFAADAIQESLLALEAD
jgi:Immunity protein 52